MNTFCKRAVLLCFLLMESYTCIDIHISDTLEILRYGQDILLSTLESAQYLPAKSPETGGGSIFEKRMEKELRNRIMEVSNKIDYYQEKMDLQMDAIVFQLIRDLPLKEKLQYELRNFNHLVGQVSDLYDIFVKYASSPELFEKYTLEDFAKSTVSSNYGALPDVLKTIHRQIVPPSNQIFESSILVMLVNQMKEAQMQICNEQQSPQQLLYNLYTTIALTEIKGYTMIQFSYVLLRLYNKGSNFTEEMQLLKEQYQMRTSETLRSVKTAMAFAPRDIWRCDPRTHKADETYTELKQLFQGFIVNEVDLNDASTCRENCAYYSYAKMYGCYQNQFCAQQRRCNGKIVNCEYIDSDMWICPSDKTNDRRYEYIEYENGRKFGHKDTCSRSRMKVDSWWRWLFWHCSYCFCYCDDHNSSSERYFNLRDVISDIANNKVITGIRLAKKNKIIHIQIQQGQLLPDGGINASTISWKPVDNYTILDGNVKKDVDYHTLAWEKRALDLDDLSAPSRYLVTGVRFRVIGTRLNLEIMVTPYDFASGELIKPLEKSYWHSNDLTERTVLELKNPDIPIRANILNIPDTSINQYLNFGPSDRESDAAQSTIPFLDIQPVQPRPPVPIAGVGIFHKGRKGSGGFVALKLLTYDFSPHLKQNLPPASSVLEVTNKISTV